MSTQEWKPNLKFTKKDTAPFIGKTLLVGITYKNLENEVDHLEQFYGTIEKISRTEGLILKLYGSDETKALPPDLTRLEKAAPGVYKLKGSKAVVKDPDYIVVWTIYPRQKQ